MRKRIIAVALAAAMMLAMPISAMATAKPDEWSAPIELEETNATQVQPITIKNPIAILKPSTSTAKRDTMCSTLYWLKTPTPIGRSILFR